MASRSVNDNGRSSKSFETSSFRSSMTSKEGHVAGRILDGKIIGVNMVNWTVDFASTFDRHRLLNIQVGSPYMHYSNGEGIYAMPEIGAKCAVCIPSDSSPPFVLSFIMPFEKVDDVVTADAPQGTRSHGGTMKAPSDARFDGGRSKAKPGDIFMRGRDGQFVILHRGGVLQIGATELAQRIFLPLENHMMDISERYSHHNVGGSVSWGLAEGQQDQSVTNVQTYRVYAEDKYADIRISKGKVLNAITPEGELEEDVVYEVVVSPKGFNAYSGDAADGSTGENIKYQFVMDRAGNISQTISGNVFCHIKKKLRLNVDEGIEISTNETISLSSKNGMDIGGGVYSHLKGDLVRLGQGEIAVARKGDMVSTPITGAPSTIIGTAGQLNGSMTVASLPVPGTPCPVQIVVASFAMGTGTITMLQPQIGTVVNGNEQVKA